MAQGRTASQIGSYSRNKGAAAERAVCTYLRLMGFEHAERAVRTGYRTASRSSDDPGDITGVPGVILSVKDTQTHTVGPWLQELYQMDSRDTLALRVLVVKRNMKKDPGQWRAIMRFDSFAALAGMPTPNGHTFPVEATFGDITTLLINAGYAK